MALKPATPRHDLPDMAVKRLTWPLRLTWAGMCAERAWRAFWPLITLIMAAGAAVLTDLPALIPDAIAQAAAAAVLLAAVALSALGLWRFRWPGRAAARARLDETLPGRPIAALSDEQAIGVQDDGSRTVWTAHQARMADRLRDAKPVKPNLRLAARDPYALRYVALLALVMAVGFGTLPRMAEMSGLLPGTPAQAAVSASWEGWVEPPDYTGEPSFYLNDQPQGQGPLIVPAGSRMTLRFYGQLGVLGVNETVSGTENADDPQPAYAFDVVRDGRLVITGPGGAEWAVVALDDRPPDIAVTGDLTRTLAGDLELPFSASDDYGIAAGQAAITLELDQIDRSFGLAVDPEPRAPVLLDLPMPFRGDRAAIEEVLADNLALHPWAGLPVRLTLTAEDGIGQTGSAAPLVATLPGRRFLDPMAQALIEQRRDLLWSRGNGTRVARLLRAVSHRPDGLFDREVDYLKLRILIDRLEIGLDYGLTEDKRDEIAQGLWDIAVAIEDGNLSGALERLRRAQERLSEAMEQGASQEELAELMDDLRQAMEEYLNQLAQQDPQGQQLTEEQMENMQTMTPEDLAEMMNQIEQLMQQGRMDEAQAMLNQLQQMMENMQMAEGQQGQGQTPGEQAMEGLRDTLRQQQGLSDEAFRDLQEQRNPGAQAGQSQGNTGRDGGQGRGQSHDGQGQGEGQSQGEGDGTSDTIPGQNGIDGRDGVDLSERQRALADELERQRNNLPGAGTEGGNAARESLDRAGRAMDDAAGDLAQNDLSGALDSQAEAMEALRDGMRNLDDALAEMQRNQQPGQQGTARGQPGQRGQNDPLGRGPNNNGGLATEAPLADGEDPYRRAQELMEELRRRAGEGERPEVERDYLRRLLDRF